MLILLLSQTGQEIFLQQSQKRFLQFLENAIPDISFSATLAVSIHLCPHESHRNLAFICHISDVQTYQRS
jgi:hypothetical protein